MDYHRHPSIQLPQELIGTIAAAVASDRNDQIRLKTLAACMLVCWDFALEFRPHFFKILAVDQGNAIDYDDALGKRLSAHAQALEDHPEYQRMVKTLVLVTPSFPPSILYDARFPQWLKGLTSVSEFVIAPCSEESLDFNDPDLPQETRDAITQLCTSPSIRKLDFKQIDNLPSRLFCDTPNLEYLNLGGVTMDASQQPPTKDELKLIASTRPHIHLNLHDTSEKDEENHFILKALAPIAVRAWKLSGQYETLDDVVLMSMCLVGAREVLRELELTFAG
jgi:hypothetical protein